MALGSKMDHRLRCVLGKHSAQRRVVTDIDLFENIARMAIRLWDRGQIGGIGQLIDVYDEGTSVIEQMTDYRGPNEASSAGHKNGRPLEPVRPIGGILTRGHGQCPWTIGKSTSDIR